MFGGVVDSATGLPSNPPSEEQFTVAPDPCLRICASSYFMQAHTPKRADPRHRVVE